ETKMAMMERRWIPNWIVPGAQAPVSLQPPLRGEGMSPDPRKKELEVNWTNHSEPVSPGT
ncbi:MAG TPA: hypothetical protein PKE58_05295, partial [Acidobacteriota bacterium]|nr:hypothetical protein [Acidobacteriota bacterium]